MKAILNALSIASCAALINLAGGTSAQAQGNNAKPASIEDQIKKESQGVGRFRGGWYGALGWGFGSKIEDRATGGSRPSGFEATGGLYGLFNPIRDFADVEVGGGLKAVFPTSTSGNGGGQEYKSGFIAATLYAGPVFRLGQGSASAIALGAQLDLNAKVLHNTADPFFARYNLKMKPALGVYGEYQYKGDGSKAIYFSRLSAARYSLDFTGAPASIASQDSGTMVELTFGIKY